jgi:hypothetical protein
MVRPRKIWQPWHSTDAVNKAAGSNVVFAVAVDDVAIFFSVVTLTVFDVECVCNVAVPSAVVGFCFVAAVSMYVHMYLLP